MTNSNHDWRRKAPYRKAVKVAYAPYVFCDGWVRCALCNCYIIPSMIQPSHILSVGAYPELKEEPMNILPMCPECHRAYENMGKEEKAAEIERILPGRMELLRQIRLDPADVTCHDMMGGKEVKGGR